jgi:hypothetical protein
MNVDVRSIFMGTQYAGERPYKHHAIEPFLPTAVDECGDTSIVLMRARDLGNDYFAAPKQAAVNRKCAGSQDSQSRSRYSDDNGGNRKLKRVQLIDRDCQ